MNKHLMIFENEIRKLREDKSVHGVALIGSVAYGMATENSDLDILVLGEEDRFLSKEVDGICVEIQFQSAETSRQKLMNNPMEVYKYIYSRIAYDDGELARIFEEAQVVYANYQTSRKVLEGIRYWLTSTKRKLLSGMKENNIQKVSYILSTNTWKLLEGVWAVNNKPIPPSGIAFCKSGLLTCPIENWFEELLLGDVVHRANTMIKVIDWICKELCQ